ncbi:hypothetical protein [Microseira wollei]|uniref:CRISPR type III-B/RAMP module-associated protein Cmr5 n=1 Tax=Microseira wollei NIES-4236 TaxID=2530354 RepID=A0AAV3XIK5_9CYAN|nr:hypothetical protein [Microseira wollei]GET42752.1 hypothetical protein MiSe_75700 [Microseira wollei NIES-4236]
MSNSAVTNLDRLAAEKAQAVIANTKSQKASDVENTVTKTLGVLQEDGVYACFLYLLAKEKDNGKAVITEMLDLLEKLGFGWNKPMNNGQIDLRPEIVLKHITDNVTQNLERLLLTKETLEQMLIYARYGAKARQVEEKDGQEANP